VGLALSGGSAKGIAHVGVLRALERLGVRVDVVAGTSMGSVVGGLYAMGLSVDSIEAIIRAADWSALVSDDVSRRPSLPRSAQAR
jgi:NTE family protein